MCNISCNLSRNRLTFSRTGWKLFSNSEFLLAAQCCETRCNWDVTQCNAKKMRCSVAQSFRKEDPDSTSCNASCVKKCCVRMIAKHVTHSVTAPGLGIWGLHLGVATHIFSQTFQNCPGLPKFFMDLPKCFPRPTKMPFLETSIS